MNSFSKDETMRLFVAVNFDEATKSRLLAIQDRIKAQSARGNFSRPENLHLTLVFIGEVAADLVPEIIAIVKNALGGACNASTMNFSRTGCFRHSGKELWWIGPDSDAEPGIGALAAIRQRIGDGLDAAGIHYDRRPFRVHITLGREIKPSAPIVLPKEDIQIPINRVSLMKSERLSGVLTYTEIFGQDLNLEG